MMHDDRIGSSFKSRDQVSPIKHFEEEMVVSEVNWDIEEPKEESLWSPPSSCLRAGAGLVQGKAVIPLEEEFPLERSP